MFDNRALRAVESGKTNENLHYNPRIFLIAANSGHSELRCKPSQIIFRQGDTADAVFYIDKGQVQLTVVSEDGKKRVIAVLENGAFFGEGCLSGQTQQAASAIAVNDTVLIRIEKDTMVCMLRKQPIFSEMFVAFLLSRNLQIENDLIDQLCNSSEKRLARTLLLLANLDENGKVEVTIPKISQELLAERVGTTRSRISFFMNKFRKMGLIEYGSEIRVRSSLLKIIAPD